MKHIVIVGGGFAGVRLARKLRKQKDVAVTLINSTPDFRYYPALYRAATGYKIGASRLPLEWTLLDNSNVDLIVGTVTGLNADKKIVTLRDGTSINYDYVVFALGSVTTYFNIEGLHEHSYGIKTSEEVFALRRHLHDKITSQSEAEANYVIVGGGPTGVEMAGALGNYLKSIARRHRVKRHNISIWLVDAAPRIIPLMPERASKAVAKRLTKLGIKILCDTQVKAETINNLNTSSGSIKTHTVIWTAGTTTSSFYQEQGDYFKFGRGGKVIVNKHLEAQPGVYVIGDNALTPYSGLALTAIRHANFVAKDIKKRMHNKKRPHKFERLPAHVVPVGDGWAVMDYGKLVLHGRPISWVRKAADYLGYSDVLGYFRALSIWSNGDRLEDDCAICHKNS